MNEYWMVVSGLPYKYQFRRYETEAEARAAWRPGFVVQHTIRQLDLPGSVWQTTMIRDGEGRESRLE